MLIHYKAKNPTPFDMDFVWAAHLMFNCEEGDTIELDSNLKKAFVTYCQSKIAGDYGTQLNYPHCIIDGTEVDLRVLPGPVKNDFFKFYFLEKMDNGVCKLNYKKDKVSLKICVPSETVPYLALLYNSGGGKDVIDIEGNCIYVEPCTAAFDRADIARKHNMQSILKPYEEKEWYLKFSILEVPLN